MWYLMSFILGSLAGPLPFWPGRPAWGVGVEEKVRVDMGMVGFERAVRERERKVEMRGERSRVRDVCWKAMVGDNWGGGEVVVVLVKL